MVRYFLMASLAMVLSACSYPIKKVEINPDKLTTVKSIGTLNCSYRLLAVNDKRQNGDSAGALRLNEFTFAEPEKIVKTQLLKAGMRTAEDATRRDVVVDIKHIYINSNPSSKIPTVVYAVHLVGREVFIIRGQAVSMVWDGNDNEAYHSFSAAFQSANAQLIARLNKSCAN